MSYHYLFYGPDTYRSTEKVNFLISKYLDTNLGDTNLAKIDSQTTSIDEIVRQIYAAPFLSNKRLVILQDFLLTAKKDFQDKILGIIDKIPSTTLVVFWERGVPDARTTLFKLLNKPNQSQKFDLFSSIQLQKWIDQYCNDRGVTLLPASRQLLIDWVGPDLWRMANECNKLISASTDNSISPKLVESLVEPDLEVKSFAFVDALFGESNPEKAIKAYSLIENSGEHPLVLLSLIGGTLTKTIMVKSWQEAGISNAQISQKLKVHPFVLQKITSIFVKIDMQTCLYRQDLILTIDDGIKSGKIDAKDSIWYLIAKWF